MIDSITRFFALITMVRSLNVTKQFNHWSPRRMEPIPYVLTSPFYSYLLVISVANMCLKQAFKIT